MLGIDVLYVLLHFFFQAEDGIRDLVRSRGLGDVYKRQAYGGDGCIGIEQCFQVIVTDIAARGTTGQRMAIFPNPNNGQFTITMDGLPTIGRILVLDALGKVLQQHMIVGTSTMQIDLGDLASGMYHVRIETEREVVCLPLVVRR